LGPCPLFLLGISRRSVYQGKNLEEDVIKLAKFSLLTLCAFDC